ncbi:hypothetical protein RhiirA1_468162 [Rhizophagus irregularis]|uniref:Uncharacterized protein n=1 Tax=Rhizophagus irregularis TaxID=588596 RepID=A0A2N0RAN0_9GLOM|nr:hypothetical protein RhiirA1_468162 [Rhizophagus irregularis]
MLYKQNDDSFQHNFNDNAFNTELDNSGNQDHNAKENNLEEMKNSKKRKASDNKSQAWSDEVTCKLLDFLEDNFSKYQKGRLSRLLEKYSKVNRQNNQSGSERVDWKWMEKMDRIFGCRENVSPSHISNETTEYINDEVNEQEEVPNPEKDDKKVVKRKKNNVESLN